MKARWWLCLLIGVLLVLIAFPVDAGVLTSGSYTYVFHGRELEQPVDISTVQGTPLAPESLLRSLGLEPVVTGNAVHLGRGSAAVDLTLGSTIASTGGKRQVLPAAPMIVGERLFVPAAVLPFLGFALNVDGKFILLEDYAPAAETPSALAPQEYERYLAAHSLQTSLRGGSGAYGEISVTRLTREVLAAGRTDLSWGTRVRLLSMLEANTLLLVSVKNTSVRSISLDASKLLVHDDSGHQYDYAGTEVPIDGKVTTPIAPGATRVSVLAYDWTEAPLTLYLDSTGTTLGRVDGP